ncbi:MAG TPA: hypothetical protein VH593_04565 [Ktedonobacteraceae bacterium]
MKKGNQYHGPDLQHKIITAIPLLLVNAVAFSGQLAWASEHLQSWGTIGQVMFACALESVAVVTAYHAYLADISNDTAMRLKLASYALGLVVGILNYSHYAVNWQPTAVAIVVGLMSASSPWLWGMYSRRVSRNILMANGLIELHAVRLGAARWLWHPYRSSVVMWTSTWTGERYAPKAIQKFDDERYARKAAKELDKEQQESEIKTP